MKQKVKSSKTCKISDCERSAESRGYCNAHYCKLVRKERKAKEEAEKLYKEIDGDRKPVTDHDEAVRIMLSTESAKSRFILDSTTQRELRRVDVVKLRLRGKSIADIANMLNVSIPTVVSDINAIKDSNKKYITAFDQDDFIAASMGVFKDIEENSFEAAANLTVTSGIKSRYLSAAKDARREQIRLLQSVGLLREKPREVNVTHSNKSIDNWSAEQVATVAGAVVEAALLEEKIEDAEVVDD